MTNEPQIPEDSINDYTSKMDHLVDRLKNRSVQARQQRLKMNVVWTTIGIVFAGLFLYIIINYAVFSSGSLSASFSSFLNSIGH